MAQDSAKAAKRRTIVATLLFVESAVISVLLLWFAFLTLTSPSTEILPALGVALFGFLFAAGLFFAARGFRKGKYFGRAPAVLANLIALGVASYQFEAKLWWSAAGITIMGVVTLISAIRAIPQVNSSLRGVVNLPT